VTELWGRAKVTRWETSVDTAPVVVTGERFTANRIEGTILVSTGVVITQSDRAKVRCDFAKYVEKEKAIHFWGTGPVFVHFADARGQADFKGDRGLVTLEPKRARLIDRVQGHVIPL
jgi:hypothetical protein